MESNAHRHVIFLRQPLGNVYIKNEISKATFLVPNSCICTYWVSRTCIDLYIGLSTDWRILRLKGTVHKYINMYLGTNLALAVRSTLSGESRTKSSNSIRDLVIDAYLHLCVLYIPLPLAFLRNNLSSLDIPQHHCCPSNTHLTHRLRDTYVVKRF